jgi:ABC-type tungstate transport system substrate-binding protein
MGEQGTVILDKVLQALRDSLSLSISHVFLYAFVAIVVAFVINLFIKEIPLRKQHYTNAERPQKK